MDYELIDSGGEEKLERFGSYVLARPDPQALWEKALPESRWKEAHAWYERKGKGGEWHVTTDLPDEWQIEYAGLSFLIRPTSFKHVGLFPEQAANWQWIKEKLSGRPGAEVLNLFAYTGGATLAALQAGASVTHLDASKSAVEWAKKNAALSGLSEKPVRWIVDDTMRFVERELKRGAKYDGIILDPPSFGHGPKDELWKIEEDLVPLMRMCKELLSNKPLFVIMNGYASGYSHFAFEHLLEPIQKIHGGAVEGGELTIQESASGRLLPAGIFARYFLGTS